MTLPSATRGALRRRLLAWYRREARDLPFRRTRDPYRIWLAEILLQQTRMEAGVPYYERFVARFPDVAALAAAGVDAVLALWEGLGYYNRARNLHRAARRGGGGRGGRVPAPAGDGRPLPGVGPYPAGAIASIAFGEATAAVDGNVKRVLARLFAIVDCIDETPTIARLEALAAELVPADAPGDWNQGLMELGARVCRPRAPRCDVCPLAGHCRGYREGLADALPVRKAKAPTPHRDVAVALVRRRGKLLLCRRPEGGMLAGLWELPGGTVGPRETPAGALGRVLAADAGLALTEAGPALATVEHAYSHFRITMTAHACTVRGRARAGSADAIAWVAPAELGDYPMPGADRKILARLAL